MDTSSPRQLERADDRRNPAMGRRLIPWLRARSQAGVEHGGGDAGKGDELMSGLAPAPRGHAVINLRVAGPVLYALGLALGAFTYFAIRAEPTWLLAGGCVGLALAVFAALAWFQQPWATCLGGIALAAAFGFAYAKAVAVTKPTITIAAETQPLQLEGWVRQVEGGRNGPRLRIDVHAIQSMDAEQTPQQVRVTHRLSLTVGPGRFVRCRVVLRPPPGAQLPGDYDFRRQAFFEGLGAVGYVQGRCRGGALGEPSGPVAKMTLWVDGYRRRLADHVRHAAGERAGGFAAALVSGDRSFMDNADSDALRASGLAHLLAISGLHLAIVCGLVYLLFRRGLALIEPLALRIPVQKPAAIAALIAGAVYLLLSGASVSTQRAYIMAAIFFGAIVFDRPGFSLRAFAVAMVAVILIDPASVNSPGFQMSFAATGALIATYDAITRRRAAKVLGGRAGTSSGLYNAAESLVVTSVVASFATAPFALYHFDRVASAGLIANLAAMPIVSFVAAPAAGVALILLPVGLQDIGLRLFGIALEAVLIVAHWSADLPGQSLVPNWPMPSLAFTLLVASLAGWTLLHGLSRWVCLIVFAIGAGYAWVHTTGPDAHWSENGSLYVASADGVLRVPLVDGPGLGPLRYSDIGASEPCNAPVCTYASHRGTVIVSTPAAGELEAYPTVCIRTQESALDPSPQTCDRMIRWSDVERQGSVTVSLDRPEKPIQCAPRPWISCPRQPHP